LLGFGDGGKAVVVVGVYGGADGFAPAVGAESVDVLVLGDVDGLQLGLDHVGDRAGESWFYVAADHGGDEASEGSAEIAGGEVVAGEKAGEVFSERFGGLGLDFFLGVVEAEVGMVAGAGCATTAAIGETEKTEGHAVLWTERRHTSLLRSSFGIGLTEKERAQPRLAVPPQTKRRQECRRYDMGLKRNASRDREAQY
jgi:hypothetical protein